ncbi:hypothetical protein FRD01_15960 [Microvenator marinus]|uniref:Uncharacterized protein n=1 Tax=Microvenator marinus TaxID=2600177 RepID=A0A5B8XRX1_9DELT|nr:hypothetical protein [Microvenator marinus]QED28702.1 hypothetical protein FRD01_15960 [Microvenator marinus]
MSRICAKIFGLVSPRIERRPRNSHDAAQRNNALIGLLSLNESISHFDSSTKKAADLTFLTQDLDLFAKALQLGDLIGTQTAARSFP